MEIYEPPSSNLDDENLEHPSALKIGMGLFFVSFCIGAVSFGFELIVGAELPASSFLTTLLPAYFVGFYLGWKTGSILPTKTRSLSIAIWGLLSLTISGLWVLFINVQVFDMFRDLGAIFYLVFSVVLMLALGFSYLAFKTGEKMGLKNFKK